MTPLELALANAVSHEWQDTHVLRNAVSSRASRPALSDVAAALRRLKRAGRVESRALGTNGKAWRTVTPTTTTTGGMTV